MLTFKAGMKLLVSNNYAALYEQAIQALKCNERDPLAFFFIGAIASDQGLHIKALELFAKASEHGAKNSRYQAYHAKALMALGHNKDAKSRADIAAKLKIDDAFVADMIGTVYSRTGYHELALPLFVQATKLNPKWALFHFNLGASEQFTGDFKKAKSAYANAVSLDPKFYQAWFALVSIEKQSPDNNRLDELQTLFKTSKTNIEAQLLLGHSIAKTLEDLGQYEESLAWLEKAKKVKKNQVRYDKAEQINTFKAAKSWTSPALGAPSVSFPDKLIFIVGLPRTGTTLLDRILSSHRDILSAGELNLFSRLIQVQAAGTREPTSQAEAQIAAHAMDLQEIGNAYLAHTRNLASCNRYTTDKTPSNFLYAGLIHQVFPNARIIALRRGAMDSCLSNYRQLFATHNNDYAYAYDLRDTAAFYRQFDTLMTHYRKTLPADRFMEVRYEDIVFDQENQTRRLLSFCSLDWDEACLHFHENNAPVDTASSVQVRKPLYTGSIGRWKKYGDKLDMLKTVLGELALDGHI